MKNSNLLNRLLSYSHEKQSPQRFARYAAMLIMLLTLGVGQLWADDDVTFYIAINASTMKSGDNCLNLKVNANIGDNNTWRQVNATQDKSKTLNGKLFFSATISVKYSGVDALQIQLYNGSSWNSQHQPYNSYTASSTFSGKVYDYDTESWSAYPASFDASYTVYFVNTNDWTTPTAYAFSGCDQHSNWSGTALTTASKNYNGDAIYKINYTRRYANIIFSNAGSNQTSDLDLGSTYAGKMWDGDSWETLAYDVTLDRQSGTTGSTSITATCGSAMPSATMPERADYTFAGYFTEEGGSGTKYYNANGTSAANWPSDGTGPTTLYAHWTQEPAVTSLSVSAGDVYSGENTITLTATRNSAASSSNIQYQVKVPGGSWTDIGDAVNSLTKTYSPTSGHGTYEFRAYPSDYSTNNREASKTVYEHWTIYVRDHVDNWGSMYLYLYDNSASTEKSIWPGTACSKYNSTDKWYAVTLDSKWPNFILNNNSTKQLLGGGSIETDKSTYPNGSYWYTQWHSDGTGGDSGKKFYTLASASVSVPTVTITSATVISSTQIKLVGNITSCGGDGNTADDMKEVGFNIGSGDEEAACTSGTTFTKVFTGLTAGTTYTVKAYATNVKGKGETSTQSVTTRAGGTYTIHVRIPKNNAAPYLYAYTDDEDGKCDGTKEENATWAGAAMTLEHSGTAYKWYSYLLNKTYNKFIVSENGLKQGETQTAPQTETCYFYNSGSDGTKCGTMGCPPFTPSLMIEETAGDEDWTYKDMTGSSTYSVSVTLAAKSTYKFKPVYGGEWLGKSSTTLTRGSNSTGSLDASNETALQITTDAAGSYTFTYNSSENTITVTYPTAYVVTYNAVLRSGAGSYKSGDPSAQATGPIAVTSTDYVLAGKDVTFTAAAANTGYTFQGWFDTDEPTIGTTVPLSSDNDDDSNRLTYTASSIGGAVTVYAVYTEDMHTVTVNVVNGTITTPAGGAGSTVSAGIATGAPIAASANYGYVFSGWSVESGSATFVDASNPSTTVKATSDATIQANFFPHWSVAGSKTVTPSGDAGDPMGDWDLYTNGIDNFTQDPVSEKWSGWVDIDLPANTTFYFKIRDLNNTKWYSANSEMTYSNHTDWKMYDNVSENCRITTAGKGTYKFTWNETDKELTVTYPTSYTVTYNVSTFYNEDASHDYDNTTGGSITYKKDNDSIELTSGKYVVAGGTMTFKATPASGYRFAGWYQNQACSTEYTNGSDGAVIDDGVLTLTILDDENNKTVYAKFMENMTTVNFASTHGHVEIGGETVTSAKVGVHTTPSVTASADANYYFAGWIRTEGSDYSISDDFDDEDDYETTLSGNGAGATSGQTLTAKFVELEKVYFRNWNADSSEPLWENVYVYFTIGKSGSCPVANVSDSYKAQMAQEGTSNNYWAYVPRGVTKNTEGDIAFSNTNFDTGETFGSGEGVMRADYRAGLSMFVPQHSSSETKCSMTFYKGYWKHHNLEPGTISGYSIERYTGGSSYEPAADNGGDNVNFIVLNEDKIQYSLRVDNTGDGHNNYRINSKGGIHYITYDMSPAETGYTITTSNYQDIHMSEYLSGSPRFYITPTTQNIYTLTIDQSGDEMKLTVDYPVAKDDYRIVHTYSSGGTKKAYSDIIKSSEAGSGVTASMYINTSSSPTLTLEKCTAISPKVTWTQQGGDLWESYGSNFNKGNGVYQFDVTINTSTNAITTIENSGIYKGEFYIKTDCAPGGWTAWKANVMEKNTITFDEDDANTFDRSFCHWIDQVRESAKPMNVKCVIANDYNIAVSDTLVGDDILGEYDSGGGVMKPFENIPAAANVRFSYNSTTNELKRTYLSLAGENKLQLEGNTVSSASMIRNTDGTTFTNNATTLTALSNFTYKVDVQAREKARVRLTSIYQSNNQSLVGTFTSTGSDLDGADNAKTVEVLGGNTSNPGYKTMRIIYDFKTNYVMAAWLVDADVNVDKDTALQADLMIIRQEQDDAYQLTFGDNKSMTEVKNVYGVMKFTQSFITNSSESRYKRDLYWISFPFDVKLSDAFGMGTYGIHWIVERYDGYTRARKGFWADSPSNWKFITPYQRDSGFVMKANEGYILALDLDELGDGSLVWDNGKTDAYLYFPSDGNVGTITQEATKVIDINQDGYQCTINRATGTEGDRRIKDSYWHCIGAPSYANVSHSVATEDPSVSDGELWSPTGLLYFYKWKDDDNTLSVQKSSPQAFKAMHSYLVQYCNDKITWENVNKAPSPIAARLAETPDKEFQLALTYDDEEQDHTYVRLTDETGVTNRFEFNQDLSKEYNGGKANIWTVTADTVPVAGNSQPHPLTTTIVPVGVKIAANGEYTFSMPEGTNGGDVWLIDNANSSRTNLGLMDYTVNLTTGTYEGRFSLEFPVQNVVTEIENAANANANANANVRKVFVGGRLYILRDGKAYDATGAQVR